MGSGCMGVEVEGGKVGVGRDGWEGMVTFTALGFLHFLHEHCKVCINEALFTIYRPVALQPRGL
jgi:hypothetical protein